MFGLKQGFSQDTKVDNKYYVNTFCVLGLFGLGVVQDDHAIAVT